MRRVLDFDRGVVDPAAFGGFDRCWVLLADRLDERREAATPSLKFTPCKLLLFLNASLPFPRRNCICISKDRSVQRLRARWRLGTAWSWKRRRGGGGMSTRILRDFWMRSSG